jgi:hypothetical protein
VDSNEIDCADCGLPVTIKLSTLRRQKTASRCHSCRGARAAQKTSATLKALWQTNDYKERVKIGRECSLVENKRRRQISISLRKHFSKEVNRQALSVAVSIAMREKWQDPEWRERVVASQRRTAAEFWGFDRERFKLGLDKKIDDLGED